MSQLDKIVIIGDIHGRTIWKDIVKKESDADLIIFLGDYFDPYIYMTAGAEVNNFNEIIKFKLTNPDKVILLCGNHDLHYITDQKASRYSFKTQELIGGRLRSLILDKTIQACTYVSYPYYVWFSHAGITNTWLRHNRLKLDEKEINDLLINFPNNFSYVNTSYSDPYGDNVFQSPMWIRQRSLKDDSPYNIWQIIGHTQVNNVKNNITLEDKVICCDSLEWGMYYTMEIDPITLDQKIEIKTLD